MAVEKLAPPSDLEWTETRLPSGGTSIAMSPPKLDAVPLLVGTGLWNSFFVMLWMELAKVHAPPSAYGLLAVHGLVGVYLTWLTLARTLNTGRIEIDATSFVVRHGPIWQRGLSLATPDVARVERNPKKASRLRAVLASGQVVDLGLTFYAQEQAAFACARVSAALAEAKRS
jgi:hypothetical protein